MSDVVELTGLRVRGRHGVLSAERELGQTFVVDVALHVDTRRAAASDDLADAVDYGAVALAVHAVVAGDPVALLETLAQRIADTVLQDHRVRVVDVAVHKPSAPVTVPFDDVVVRTRRASPWVRAVLGLGANAGNPREALLGAVAALDGARGVRVVDASPVYRTAPVGGVEQADFLNAVVAVMTTLTPLRLLEATQAVEAAAGRDRGAEVRWGPRPLDVDLLTVDAPLDRPLAASHVVRGSAGSDPLEGGSSGRATGGAPHDTPHDTGRGGPAADRLELPHPRAHERAFVLVPWAAMSPDDELPGHGRVGDLAATRQQAARGGPAAERVDLVDDLVLHGRPHDQGAEGDRRARRDDP